MPIYKYYQAAVLFLLGEKSQAKYILEHLREELPNEAGLSYFLGLISLEEKAYLEAYRRFETACKITPGYWFSEERLSFICRQELARLRKELIHERVDKSLQLEYLNLLVLTRTYKEGVSYLSGLKEQGQIAPELEDYFRRLVDLYEKDLECDIESNRPELTTYLDLGEIYIYKKRYYEAYLLVRSGLEIYKDEERLQNFYNYLIKKNIEVYEALLREEKNTTYYYNIALFYAAAGEKEKMFVNLEHALKRDKKLAIQARYEDAFKPYRSNDKFRLITLIEGEDKNIYKTIN